MSGQLAAGPDLQTEFQYRDGVGYVAIRALARMLGVSEAAIRQGAKQEGSKLAKSLAVHGICPAKIDLWKAQGIPDKACAIIASYYANDARNTTEKARDFLKLTSAMGVRSWVREKCQGLDGGWAKARLDGKRVRHPFTQALQDHGCEGKDMATITDNNNVLVTGKRARQLVASRAPDAKARISGRQLMTAQELNATAVLEATQTAQITMLKPEGSNQCVAVCSAVGIEVMKLLTQPMQVLGINSAHQVNASAYRVVTASDF